jgi:hypothetical protein
MRRSTFCAATGAFAAAAIGRPARATSSAADLDVRTIPIVRARLGARVLHLAIDTRNAVSTLSVGVAGELGPQRGLVAGAFTTLSGITLGGVALRDHRAVVADIADLAREAGVAVDGALGYDAFGDRAITLDYRLGRLSFPDVLPDGESTPITWLRGGDAPQRLITFDGLVIDGFPVVAQLDTLVTKNAIVFAAKVPDLAIDNEPRAPLYAYAGTQLPPGRVGSLRLGSTLLAAQPIVYVADARTRAPAAAVAVIIGDALLGKRVVTLDFPGSTLTVV